MYIPPAWVQNKIDLLKICVHIYCLFKRRYFYVVTNLFCNIYQSLVMIHTHVHTCMFSIPWCNICICIFCLAHKKKKNVVWNILKIDEYFLFHLDVYPTKKKSFFPFSFEQTYTKWGKNPTTWIMSSSYWKSSWIKYKNLYWSRSEICRNQHCYVLKPFLCVDAVLSIHTCVRTCVWNKHIVKL